MQKLFTVSILLVLFVLSSCINKKKPLPKIEPQMEISKDVFGLLPDGRQADIYTLKNINGMQIKITNFGGIITEMLVPDKEGNMSDVVLGFDNLEQYLENEPYFGAIVGRYANRIANGKFSIDGQEYTLAQNNGENHLHGGIKGFNKVLWEAEPLSGKNWVGLKLQYVSQDGEEGYPGQLDVTVLFTLSSNNELWIEYVAGAKKATPVNLTHHSYFNLNKPGYSNILDHEIFINANRYTIVNESLIPTGDLPEVKGTPMDFTTPKKIGLDIEDTDGGYDHNFVLNRTEDDIVVLAARVVEPISGRVMEVHTTQPGIQFYTGNFLDGSIVGKEGKPYKKHFGFCLETQHFPDSPNQPDFPNTILRPGKLFNETTIYKFYINNKDQ